MQRQFNYKSDYLPRDSQGIYESPWKDYIIDRLAKEEITDNSYVALTLYILNTIHHDAVWKLVDRMPYLGYETASIMCMNHFKFFIYHLFKISLSEVRAEQTYYVQVIVNKGWFDFIPEDAEDPVALLKEYTQQHYEFMPLYCLDIFNIFGLELISSVIDSFYESMRETLALNYQKIYRSGDVNDFNKAYPLPSEEKILSKEMMMVEKICKDAIIPEIAEDLLDETSSPSLSLFQPHFRKLVSNLIQKFYIRNSK